MFEIPVYFLLGSCSFDCYHEWVSTGQDKYFWGMYIFQAIAIVFWFVMRNEDKKMLEKKWKEKNK